jgi:hypothetical protein
VDDRLLLRVFECMLSPSTVERTGVQH